MEKEILYRFFEGIASFEEEEQVRVWMEASQENERAFFKERKLFDALLLLGREKKEVEEEAPSIRLGALTKELLKIAGIVLLTLGGSYLYQQYRGYDDLSAMQTISVPAGQRVNITLPDGTNVWLNARTSIQYPLSFNKEKRQLRLNGEAYFEVTKDNKRPFVVQTDKFDVEVLGTKFNVEAYADKNEFETTLMQGSVKVSSLENPSQTFVLAPDEKLFSREGALYVVPVYDYSSYRWKEGLICFRNEPFQGIMKAFEKYYGISILVESKEVWKHSYTGKFRQTDGIDYALRILQKDIRFTYERDTEKQIIYVR